MSRGGMEEKKTECWFCLGSPQVEKHLVVSIGNEAYVAMAKGGVVNEHVLIIPINHMSNFLSSSQTVTDEINMYKDSLRKCFESQGKSVLFFERFIRSSRAPEHMHIQVVPLSKNLVSNAEPLFNEKGLKFGITFETISSSDTWKDRISKDSGYLLIELPNGNHLLHIIASGVRHPFQFAREVVAELLGFPERADWKACKLDKQQETSVSNNFKKMFQPFDFSLMQ